MKRFRQFHLGKLGTPFQWLYSLPRIFFSFFYHGLAGVYDFLTTVFSMGLWKQWLSTTLSFVDGPRVLEIGHGPGHLQMMLAANGSHVFGLDESYQMVNLARRRLKRAGFSPLLVRGISQTIPYCSESFDQVVTTFPAEFITHPGTLDEVLRVLKPQGCLVILRFAWFSDRRWPYKAAVWLLRLVGEAPGLNDSLPQERLAAPFQEAGFSVQIEQIDLESSSVVIIHCQK